MKALLEEQLANARRSADEAREAIDFLETQRRVLDGEKNLQPLLRQHHQAHFGWAVRAATGPGRMDDLRKWCTQKRLDEERKQVEQLLGAVKLPLKPSADYARRNQLREQREVARKAVDEFIRTRSRGTAAEVRRIVDWMRAEKFGAAESKGRLKDYVRRLVGEGDAYQELAVAIDALEHSAETKLDEKKVQARVAQASKELGDRLLAAVDKCLAANEPGLGFELFRHLLRVDPDNARAHRGLGHVKVQDRWLRPYQAEQFRAGWAWDDGWGWVLAKERARYERGEYLDPESKRWDKLESLNKLHSNPQTPWKLRSEHFELHTTADLGLAVEVLKRLEDFFLQAFAEYDVFFAKPGSLKGADLIFGVAPTAKRLLVWFYRDAAQFKSHAKPPTSWAAGFYSGAAHASYFHAINGKVSPDVLQHELTHQILGEFSSYGGAPPWLAEGAAVYLEAAFFRDGVMTLGRLEDNRDLAQYVKGVKAGKGEHSFRRMLQFQASRDWDAGEISKNYRGAGSVVYFLMTFDGGRYRGDFIEMLRDAYNGVPRPVEDYFGLSLETLDSLHERFYRER